MSIFENLKKVLEIHVFFQVSEHNAVISDFYVNNFVTIKFIPKIGPKILYFSVAFCFILGYSNKGCFLDNIWDIFI
jgi:hypothetical protein